MWLLSMQRERMGHSTTKIRSLAWCMQGPVLVHCAALLAVHSASISSLTTCTDNACHHRQLQALHQKVRNNDAVKRPDCPAGLTKAYVHCKTTSCQQHNSRVDNHPHTHIVQIRGCPAAVRLTYRPAGYPQCWLQPMQAKKQPPYFL